MTFIRLCKNTMPVEGISRSYVSVTCCVQKHEHDARATVQMSVLPNLGPFMWQTARSQSHVGLNLPSKYTAGGSNLYRHGKPATTYQRTHKPIYGEQTEATALVQTSGTSNVPRTRRRAARTHDWSQHYYTFSILRTEASRRTEGDWQLQNLLVPISDELYSAGQNILVK